MANLTVGNVNCPSCGLPSERNGEQCFHCGISPYTSKAYVIGPKQGKPHWGEIGLSAGIVLLVFVFWWVFLK